MIDLSGKTIDRYQIIESIGQGGMASVYRAYDTRLSREVAIKFIRTDLFGPAVLEELLKRFEREAKALAQFDHPHIIHVYDYGEYDDSPYLVMQFLPGGTLDSKMGAAFGWQEAVDVMLPLAQALDYAHQREVIHRDIKPANILLSAEEQPKLTDFGIAKLLQSGGLTTLTETGATIGTPEYMSPEQAMGAPADHRSDIYSLGIVFYELVTGQKPFEADTPVVVIIKHINEPLPDPRDLAPDLPVAVEEVLRTALAKQPDDRFDDMTAFIDALEALRCAGPGSAAQPAEVSERSTPAARLTPITQPVEPPVGSPDISAGLVDAPSPTSPHEAPQPFFPKGNPPWLLFGGLAVAALLIVGLLFLQSRFFRTVPDLTGMTSLQAAAELEEYGLIGYPTFQVTPLSFGSQQNVIDSVVSQDTAVGKKVVSGSIVEYNVVTYITNTPTTLSITELPAVMIPVTATPTMTLTPVPTATRAPTLVELPVLTDTRVPTLPPTPTDTRMPTLTASLTATNAPWATNPTDARLSNPTAKLQE
jgi:serine/threonine protein kinase